jgi:hypothetical protein
MPLTKADKEFIKLNIKPIQLELKNLNEKFEKQNGRVNELEEESHKRALVVKEMNVWHKSGREQSCPMKPKINKIDEDLMEYKMIKLYPKTFIVMSVCFTAWMIWEMVQHFILP